VCDLEVGWGVLHWSSNCFCYDVFVMVWGVQKQTRNAAVAATDPIASCHAHDTTHQAPPTRATHSHATQPQITSVSRNTTHLRAARVGNLGFQTGDIESSQVCVCEVCHMSSHSCCCRHHAFISSMWKVVQVHWFSICIPLVTLVVDFYTVFWY